MEKKRVLITVKTYPIPSKKYDELVCTAGVEEDGSFVRLYPINFRDLSYEKHYRKYQWIEVMVDRHKDDHRKESYRPDNDTLQRLGEPMATKKGDWSERAKIVLKQKAKSMEDLHEQKALDKTSLGIFKPKEVLDLTISENDEEWNPSFLNKLKQTRIWEDRNRTLEPPRKIPYKFFYRFTCDDSRCKGKHRMSIHDWELGAFYWRMVDQGNAPLQAAEKTKDRFFNQLCGTDIDTHFFVGTVSNHPNSWVVIGIWYPKFRRSKLSVQTSLNLFDEDMAE